MPRAPKAQQESKSTDPEVDQTEEETGPEDEVFHSPGTPSFSENANRRRSTRKRKSIDTEETPPTRVTPGRRVKKSRSDMAGVGRSPTGKTGTPKGKSNGADATAGQVPGYDATPTERLILKEMKEVKAMMGGMEGRLGVRVTELEKKVEESATNTVKAMATLEARVKKNEKELGPTINRALDD